MPRWTSLRFEAGSRLAGRFKMKPLYEAIEEYIQMRQALGLKFKHAARGLRHFGSFLESNGATHVTVS